MLLRLKTGELVGEGEGEGEGGGIRPSPGPASF